MGDIKNTETPLKYMGRQLGKEGTDKNGKQYKLYKLTFMTPTGRALTFNGFLPWSSDKGTKLDALEEGHNYNIAYTEYSGTSSKDGKPFTSKTAIGFYHPDQQVQATPAPVKSNTNYSEFGKNFAKAYATAVSDPKQRNETHFLGSFVKTLVKTGKNPELKVIVDAANEAFKQMPQPEAPELKAPVEDVL